MLHKLYRMIANRPHPRIVTIVNKVLIRVGCTTPLYRNWKTVASVLDATTRGSE